MTWFIRTLMVIGEAWSAYFSRIALAASIHSADRNGYGIETSIGLRHVTSGLHWRRLKIAVMQVVGEQIVQFFSNPGCRR